MPLTIPNLLTFFRIIAIPLVVRTLLSPRRWPQGLRRLVLAGFASVVVLALLVAHAFATGNAIMIGSISTRRPIV